MESIQRFVRRTAVVQELAHRLGLDLAEALMEGTLTPAEFRTAALRCAECAMAAPCAERLGDGRDGMLVSQPPQGCPNGAMLDRLLA